MNHHDTTPGSPAPTDADILITRIIDGEASPEDWAAFKALAARQPEVWRDLAECQQDHADLSAAVSAAWRIADSIDLPVEEARSAQLSRRVRGAMAWGGWAMAAAVALAFTTQRPAGNSAEPMTAGPTLGPGVIPVSTPEQAYDAYLELGRQEELVLEEVPTRILVETRALDDGTVEVRYLRQILERVTVPSLYEFGQDEAGRPVPIRVRGRVVESPI
jgi:hypothetical protein